MKKNRIFFKCLKPGHAKPNCKSSIKCYKCKKEGDYHTALCNPNKVSDNPTEEEITCLVKNNTNILQQTVNALVTDKNETRFRGKIIIRRRVTTDIHNSKGSR